MALKVLLLNNRVPYPLFDGGAKATHSLIEGILASDIELDLFFINTPKHFQDLERTKEIYPSAVSVSQVNVDTKVTAMGAFKSLLNSTSYNVERFDAEAAHEQITQILKQKSFDIVHFETMFMTPYLETVRKYSQAKCILRMHNVEHQIWQKLAVSTGSFLKRGYLQHLAKKLKQYEERNLTLFDGILPISEQDASWVNKNSGQNVLTLPMGIDVIEKPMLSSGSHFFHIGSMEWKPNIQGCQYLVENIWPKVLAKSPDIHLHLAGKAMDNSFNHWRTDNVHLHGEVPDAKAFMQEYNCMIIPLKSASGLRIKALEAMSLGKPIISTSLGMSGISIQKGKNCLIADSEEEMVQHIVKIASDQNLYHKLASNSHTFVSEHFSKDKMHQNLINYYEKICVN